MDINIVCCLDDRFVMPCGVLLLSVCENNKNKNIVFHIVSEGLKADNIIKLEAIVKQYDCAIHFYNVNTGLLKIAADSPGLKNPNWPISVYFRLLLCSTLPENVDKVLYLDCDTLVCGSLAELWNMDIEGYAVAAAPDSTGDNIMHYNRLDYDFSLGYFNAGVLLINLLYWRNNDIERKLLEYTNKNVYILEYNDQDVLNYVFREQKKIISIKYNLMLRFFWQTRFLFVRREYWEDISNAINNPIIIHYGGRLKPWHKESTLVLKEVWLKYYKLSLWGDIPLTYKTPFKTRLYLKIRKSLQAIEPSKLRSEFANYTTN